MKETVSMSLESGTIQHSIPRLDMAAAAAALQNGQLVAFPTETYYGVGGTALSSHVAAAVFRAKQRPHGFALPVIISSREILDILAREIPPLAVKLMDTFWPGPLSILLPASAAVPPQLVGDSGCVAVRLSPHPVAHSLSKACQGAIIASSANMSGQPPAVNAVDLDPQLTRALAGVVDIPPYPTGGAPSTLVGLTGGGSVIQILRAGAVSVEKIQAHGIHVE